MKNGHVRLVVSDFDGTLCPIWQPFSPRVRNAVHAAQARGVRVVVATGRMFRTVFPMARELGLESAIICDQGATIRDLKTTELLFEKNVPLDLARQVVAFAGSELTALVCRDEEFYSSRLTQDALDFVERYPDHLHIVPELAQSLADEPQKIVFVNDVPTTDRLVPQLKARFGDVLQVVQSHDRFVEVTHRDVSKGNAAAWLAQRWNIPREQVMAMGDHDNDRSMIEWAGLGVAMGNAIDSVKAVANYIAPSVLEDGAAVAIEKFVLNGDG